MSSSGQQWQEERPEQDAARGPSFEDPTDSSRPVTPQPAPQQSWDAAWGLTDEPEQGTGEAWGADAPTGGGPHDPTAPPNHGDAAPGPASNARSAGEPPQYGQPNSYGGQQYPYAQQDYGQQDPYGQYAPQPYGTYGGYGPQAYAQPMKSKTAAALLAFFLGSFGAHSFYLNKRNLGLIHLGLAVGGFVVMVVSAILGSEQPSGRDTIFVAIFSLAMLAMVVNSLWAFVEFIVILLKPEHELGR